MPYKVEPIFLAFEFLLSEFHLLNNRISVAPCRIAQHDKKYGLELLAKHLGEVVFCSNNDMFLLIRRGPIEYGI